MVATHISMTLEIGMATLNVNDISGKVELNGNLSGWMSAFGGFDTKAAFPDSPTLPPSNPPQPSSQVSLDKLEHIWYNHWHATNQNLLFPPSARLPTRV
jgi:hypothetical protein